MGYLSLLLALVMATGCGSKLNYQLNGDSLVQGKARDERALKGVIEMVDGTTLDLDQTNEPIVLMFATLTCLSCKAEAKRLKEFFATKPALPKNVKVVTILVGNKMNWARMWRDNLDVPWQVGITPNEMFFERCSERLTPCILTQNLHSEPPVNKRIGEVDPNDLEKETGPWSY